jgi:hypothetical protein
MHQSKMLCFVITREGLGELPEANAFFQGILECVVMTSG